VLELDRPGDGREHGVILAEACAWARGERHATPRPHLTPGAKAVAAADAVLADVPASSRLIGLHVSGGQATKQWDLPRFAEGGWGRTSGAGTAPFTGGTGQAEKVREERVEVLPPLHLQGAALRALRAAHPYEEVAYELIRLENAHQDVGSGMIGELPEALSPAEFRQRLRSALDGFVLGWLRGSQAAGVYNLGARPVCMAFDTVYAAIGTQLPPAFTPFRRTGHHPRLGPAFLPLPPPRTPNAGALPPPVTSS